MDQKTDPLHTSQQILDIAQHLVQTRGFNAFSYANIAAKLQVTKASLHYHFVSKARLGERLIQRYGDGFRAMLGEIDRSGETPASRLAAYLEIHAGVLASHRMCLCGMLAAEHETLPKVMQTALDEFFTSEEGWLAVLLEAGRLDGTLNFQGPAAEAAQYIIGSVEGAMMMARTRGGIPRFQAAARRLLAEFHSQPRGQYRLKDG